MQKIKAFDKVSGASFIMDETNYQNVFIPEEFSEEQRLIAKTTEEFVTRDPVSGGCCREIGL